MGQVHPSFMDFDLASRLQHNLVERIEKIHYWGNLLHSNSVKCHFFGRGLRFADDCFNSPSCENRGCCSSCEYCGYRPSSDKCRTPWSVRLSRVVSIYFARGYCSSLFSRVLPSSIARVLHFICKASINHLCPVRFNEEKAFSSQSSE